METLYRWEEGLWGYYVKGCPIIILVNINTSRGLVNGCSGRMDSLTLEDESE